MLVSKCMYIRYFNFILNCLVYMIVCFFVVGEYWIIYRDFVFNNRKNFLFVKLFELKIFEIYIDNDFVFKKYLYKRKWCWIKFSILCYIGLLYMLKKKREKKKRF